MTGPETLGRGRATLPRRKNLPVTTRVASIGVLVMIVEVAIRFFLHIVEAWAGGLFLLSPLLMLTASITLTLPIYAFVLLYRGNRWAPALLTVLALWDVTTSVIVGIDVLSAISGIFLVAGAVAAWMPSAMAYARAQRSSSPSKLSGSATAIGESRREGLPLAGGIDD